jgi:hypothetical protein
MISMTARLGNHTLTRSAGTDLIWSKVAHQPG